MLQTTKPPRLASSAALEMVLLGKLNNPDNSHQTPSAQALQERYVLGRWRHISQPVARVVAHLAFESWRRA